MCEKESVAIAKIETSGRCNHAVVKIHTNTHPLVGKDDEAH
jgi:hypothetical protein